MASTQAGVTETATRPVCGVVVLPTGDGGMAVLLSALLHEKLGGYLNISSLWAALIWPMTCSITTKRAGWGPVNGQFSNSHPGGKA